MDLGNVPEIIKLLATFSFWARVSWNLKNYVNEVKWVNYFNEHSQIIKFCVVVPGFDSQNQRSMNLEASLHAN